MQSYAFTFAQDWNAVEWRRDFPFSDDEAAIREGRLMLEAQAEVRRVATASIEVGRIEGEVLRILGTWYWKGEAATWDEVGSASTR